MSTPRFSVIESTTPNLSFAEDLVTYREAGVDAIGIVEAKLMNDRDDLALFHASGMKASSCFLSCFSILPSPYMPGPQDPFVRLETLCRSIERLAPFEPDCCFVVPGPPGRYELHEARQIVIQGIHKLSRAAGAAGMTLGVELMHPSLSTTFGFIHSIGDGIDVLDEVGRPNVALAIDVWHLEEPDLLAHLRANATRFASLHLNDRPEVVRSWCDRALPGDGVADIRGILGSLEEGGFDGWFELEVLSDDGSVEYDFPDSLWKRDPLELVRVGRAQFLTIWDARRTTAVHE